MKTYSMDLRERILQDCDAGMEARQVALKYRVSESWIRRLKQRRRETGEVAPRRLGSRKQPKWLPHAERLQKLVEEKPDATLAELETACRAAQIHDTVAALPEGYETIVGERGYRLSGGEKQRLAIARVLLKDPAVVILDEATSHLDSENEAAVQDALDEALHGRTSIVIAHRLSTIQHADVILVLDNGEIVERGTHESLLADGGLYAELYHTLIRDQVVG